MSRGTAIAQAGLFSGTRSPGAKFLKPLEIGQKPVWDRGSEIPQAIAAPHPLEIGKAI